MVNLREPLNARQLEVLRWVGDGCPLGVMDGHSHKTTAVALRNRHLLTISRRGGAWSAELTGAGRHYLDTGQFLAAEKSAEQRPKQRRPRPGRPKAAVEPTSTDDRSRSAAPPRTGKSPGKALSKTEQLIADLIAGGGVLEIDTLVDKTNYDARVAAAIRFGKVPPDKQLVIDGSRWGRHRTIRLQDPPEWLYALLDPVPVPATLRSPHKVVVALRERGALPNITGSARQRALRLIQGLVVAAEAQGMAVKAHVPETDRYGYSRRTTKDNLSISSQGFTVGIEIQQQVDRTPHEPTPAELARAERESWFRIPKFDSHATDRLTFLLPGRYEHRQSRWADTKALSLEDHLPQIVQEIELRGEAAERERLRALEVAAEKRRAWEAAMEAAVLQYREDFRYRELQRQLADWSVSNNMREYLSAMSLRIAELSGDERLAAEEWLDWALARTRALDPLQGTLALPDPPAPAHDQLKPFLGSLSPFGPSA